MKTKLISLSLLALGVCGVAIATEYKNPDVGFKKHTVPSKEMKVTEFGEYYRVEGSAKTDRQIASEESDREPSSVIAQDAKKKKGPDVQNDEPVEAPRPWMYRQDANSSK